MLTRIPNYIKTFGLAAGLKLFASMHLQFGRSGELFGVIARGQTIWLRNTPSDTSIFFQIMVKREYETGYWPTQHELLSRAYDSLVASGQIPVIIDAGANIGLASIWFANRYPLARVYAVEPESNNISILRQNVAALANVIVLPGAVWNAPANLFISNPEAGAGAFRVGEGVGSVTAYTVCDILSMEPNSIPFIIKIDIEGGESELFRSNTSWLETAHLVVIETHDWLFPGAGTSQTFLKSISNVPVDLLLRGENLFCFMRKSYPNDTNS